MIILNLQGGLGNQIYQYNFALLLAKKLNKKIIVNDEIIRRGNFKNELFKLGIEHKRANTILGFILYVICSVVYKFNLRNYINSKYIYFYLDPQTGYDQNIERVQSKIIFLNGYFQSHRYLLENIFEIQNLIYRSLANPTHYEHTSNQVCVHVRRGDYLEASNKDIFSELDIDYYLEAMEIIQGQHSEKLVFKIFSNDIEYCKLAFKETKHNIVFIQGIDPVDDFKEMMACDHFIIANSTFSLLASIYSKSSSKFVIAPKQWFNADTDISLIPSSYIRI
jgi:hypothetical protein